MSLFYLIFVFLTFKTMFLVT